MLNCITYSSFKLIIYLTSLTFVEPKPLQELSANLQPSTLNQPLTFSNVFIKSVYFCIFSFISLVLSYCFNSERSSLLCISSLLFVCSNAILSIFSFIPIMNSYLLLAECWTLNISDLMLLIRPSQV